MMTTDLADAWRVMNNRVVNGSGQAMWHSLKRKRAIVTGGASGIGRAIVRLLALEEVRTAVADLDLERAQAVAAEAGPVAQAFRIDVRDRGSVEACFGQIEQEFGGYDILCANAGVSTMATVERLTDED